MSEPLIIWPSGRSGSWPMSPPANWTDEGRTAGAVREYDERTSHFMQTLRLENETLRLDFDRSSGALVGLTALPSGWQILNRPHLGLSFRLLVPLVSDDLMDREFAARMGRPMPSRRNNPVYGEKQTLTALAPAPDGRGVTFTWENVVSEAGGPLPIKVQLAVTLTARQAIFALTLENRSPHIVENAYCPYLGDVQHPAGAAWLKTFTYQYATALEHSLWPTYQNLRGYFGFDYPVQFKLGTPPSPFFLLRAPSQGLYAGVAAPSPEPVAWHTELRPGYGSSIDFRVPETATIAGKDVATRFAAIHFAYIAPGETRALTPIALQAYQGDWQQGVDVYKTWRSSWMKAAQPPAWAREPHSWQQIHINSPEDELRLRFCDLVTVGEECARHGVKAIQLVGWNDGGQDQGNPSHDPDPRLGTFDELKAAIAAIRALGVKVILFAKFTWSDRATARFRDDLIRLAAKDPYGDYYVYAGYQYQTATQGLDINTKRLIPMCFSSEEYLRICDAEFAKMLGLGADGMLFDEACGHGPGLLCFDEGHGHRYGAPVYANDRKLIQNFARLSEPVRPDFLYACEASYDWEFEAYHVSYHRSENKQHVPLMRYLQPHAQLITAVTGFDDRNLINQCLMYRYIISYEPYNFKGHLDDFPLTTGYGRQMDALRTELRDYFWDGEFCDEVGAQVTANGQPHHPYAVFINARNGKRGLVVCNYDEQNPVTVQVALDGGGCPARYRLVDDPAWRATAGGIVLPPCSAAMVVD
jgi:hypothetical protein